MPKYRKLPVEIEAIEYRATNLASVLAFIDAGCGTTIVDVYAPAEQAQGHIDIPTLEGTMRARVGDWIIRGVKGELYPCKPDIFATTYEPIAQPKGK
jgi:hypothetical protein